MKTSWLQCFLAVEKFRKFSTAAESLFITQSSLSKQIKALEEELDVQLFDRSTHVIKLTQAGEKVLLHAQWINKEESSMRHDLESLKQISKGKLSIAAPHGMAYYDIVDMIIDFEKKHPKITAETHEKDHDFMVYSLENEIVDFCIDYREFWDNSGNFCEYHLYEDSMVIVLGTSHPLAGMEHLTLADAQDYMFCVPREESGLFQLFLNLCHEIGFSPKITLSDVRISTIKRYVEHGLRLTVVSAFRAAKYFNFPQFRIVHIDGAPSITLSLMHRNERLTVMQKKFISHAKQWYSNLS